MRLMRRPSVGGTGAPVNGVTLQSPGVVEDGSGFDLAKLSMRGSGDGSSGW